MFKELTEKLSYPDVEKEILKFWKENGIFEKSISTREGKPGFTFYEGPPTANGRPGIHHVMSRTLKDLVCRYKTMRGFQVHRKAGWDTHGLPVEIEVEKQLGFKHKDEIVKYGVAEFNKKCRESVWKYKTDWEKMTEQMGYWVDLTKPYVTFENNYIESIWWALKRFYDEGMIYKGYKIQPYCPRCETPLSSHEVSLGYDDVKDPSVYVKLKLKSQPDTSFLVWTTTPWTLISNVALAVHPDVEYVKVEHKGEKLILAEARLNVLEGEYSVLEKMKGSALSGLEYERIFNYHPVDKKAHYVVEAVFVTTEDGSGIVHMAPAYGEDDYQISKLYNLPTIHPVNKSGEFTDEVTDFAGKFVKDADPLIIQNLKQRGILYRKETITHSYPHCWRCKTPLLYYARESWYISTTKYAQKMIDLNRQINWVPPEVGEGRFGNWLEENKDWALSRDRFWGTPLPIWICEKCTAQKCVGSVEEFKNGSNVPDPLDLHKPFVDAVTFTCSCGGTMRRTPELIDVWFDSGAMSFAQWHYPFENRELIDSGEQYPADFICEGIDQTRGWFYSLHAIGTFLFNKPAYKNLIVNELILDKDGQKMSKSKGNTVDPFATIAKYGADTTRWYLVTTSPPWRPTMFDEAGLGEVQRKFFGTLVNTYAFFALYANIDRFTHAEQLIPVSERQEIDRWVLSELNSLRRRYRELMEAYDVTKAAKAVSEFTINHLSNWYVRRNRRRFWKSERGKDKTAAYQTLYECLTTIAKLTAPFAPFISEELYRNLNSVTKRQTEESVHLAMMPEVEGSSIDAELESKMERAQLIVELVRSMRMKSNLKVRQPLKRIILPVANEQERSLVEQVKDVILEEINVKAIEFVTDDSGIVKKKAKANFKSIGPKFGKSVKLVADRIKEMSAGEIGQLERSGSFELPVNGSSFTIGTDDVEIVREDLHGWLVESDGGVTVALDTELSDELIAEGFAREFVSRVQNMRKDAGFDVTDRIIISYRSSGKLSSALQKMREYIMTETLAVELSPEFKAGPHTSTQDINGEIADVSIERRS
ncbi:MAG: isoleucine--tRNA ligase [Bacteroidetes bacterium]|nr:isoleucine--tRNA ligase [Bacteroidota bacterium]MCW5895773.1 isoleucine--tRNA ligase [Bacteroidota bacterium]